MRGGQEAVGRLQGSRERGRSRGGGVVEEGGVEDRDT